MGQKRVEKEKVFLIRTTEDLCAFTREQVIEAEVSPTELVENLRAGQDRKKPNYTIISKAIAPGERSNPGRNGIRKEILAYLGFQVNDVFEIKQKQK